MQLYEPTALPGRHSFLLTGHPHSFTQQSLPTPREEFYRALRDSCHILLNVNKHTEQLLASVNLETIYSTPSSLFRNRFRKFHTSPLSTIEHRPGSWLVGSRFNSRLLSRLQNFSLRHFLGVEHPPHIRLIQSLTPLAGQTNYHYLKLFIMMRTGVAALGALSLINLASAKPSGHHRKLIN